MQPWRLALLALALLLVLSFSVQLLWSYSIRRPAASAPPLAPPRKVMPVGLHRKVYRAARGVVHYIRTGRIETAAERRARAAAAEAALLRAELRSSSLGWREREHTLVEEILQLREAAEAARRATERDGGEHEEGERWWRLLDDGAAAPLQTRVRLGRQRVHGAAAGLAEDDAGGGTVSEKVKNLFGGP